MREINVSEVTEAVKNMCIDANYALSDDMKKALETAQKEEVSELGKQIFSQLEEIIAEINEKYRQKGEYENIISQLEEAEALGADAIVNIRYASSAVIQGAAEVITYGTAVKFVQ